MSKRTTFDVVASLLAATLLPVACRDSVSPDRFSPTAAAFAMAASPIALDQQNGTLNETNRALLRKGFNPTNPRLGTAIVATFFWLGTTATVIDVTDVLADGTPVGNRYEPVEYIVGDGISMATFVATNVQNFPEGTFPDGFRTLVVQATLSDVVVDGGVMISSYSGVDPVFPDALGEHRSDAGSGSTQTIAHPGAIALNAGALGYGVTLSNRRVDLITPPDFTTLTVGPMEDGFLRKTDGEYTVRASGGSADPQWTWSFDQNPEPGTWLASVLALNPAPPPATHLVFTVQPSNTTAGGTISPAVQVAAQDDAGNTVVGFGADITIALGNNPAGGTLSGTKIVTAVNGVATFSDLSIDRAGNGYTLVATATGLTGATSAPFNIAAPQVRVDVSGGGRIDPAIGKTTFGFDVDSRSGPPFQGDMQVVYHGGTSPMTRIHSVVIDGVTSSPDPRGGVCITWTGSARVNNGDQRRFTATACDNGQPGSSHGAGPDRFGISVDGSVNTGLTDLKGGNTQVRQ